MVVCICVSVCETFYEGSEIENVCDQLTPDQMSMVRVACSNVAERIEVSCPPQFFRH